MTSMLERCARAIVDAGDEWIMAQDCMDQATFDDVPSAILARAVLTTLRDNPSEAMIDRFVSRALCVSVHGDGGWSNYAREQWVTMLTAALEE